jgi:hypothetical protein
MRALSQSDYGEIRSLYESIYTPQVDEELELSDEELTEAVEDAVSELIEEGYDIDDIEDAFDDELIEEILDEAKVTMGKGGRVPLSRDAGKGPEVTSGSGNRMAAASRLSRMKDSQKIARQKERKEKVKSAVKTVKDTAKSGVSKAKEAGREAKFQAVDKKVAAYANKRKLDNAPGLKARSKDPEKRRGLRAKVAGDIVSRAKGKLERGVKKVTDTAKGVKAGAQIAGSIAKDEARRAGRNAKFAGGKAVTAVKNAPEKAGTAARKGLKGLIKRGAEKVASGASKVAKRMSEEVETYDVVVEFLCDYGIAENLQEAQMIMVNEIDSEDIKSILEAYGLDELYKGKHGQTEKQYQDGRSMAGKMISGDSKGSGANYSYKAKNTGSNPAGGSKKPQGQARMSMKDRAYLAYQKANLK